MLKKIINKIFGIQYIKVTYKVTDCNPYIDEPISFIDSVIIEKYDDLSIEDRLPCYGYWADIDILKIENV